MPAIEILLATIQDERRRRMDEARLVRAATSGRPTLRARLVSAVRPHLRSQRDAARSAQPATGTGSVGS